MSYAGSIYKTKITIDKDLVGATQTDFVLPVIPSVLPAAMLDSTSGTSLQADGGDLLAYVEEPLFQGTEPTTRLAIDIRELTVAAGAGGTCDIAIAVPTVSSLVDTDIWLAWGDAAGSQPGVSAPYGRNAVYSSDYAAAYAFSNSPGGSAPQLTDRTGNGGDATSSGMDASDLVDGKLGNAWDFDGVNDFATANSPSLDTGAGNALSFLGWHKTSQSGGAFAGWGNVFRNGPQTLNTDGYELQHRDGQLVLTLRGPVNVQASWTGPERINDGTWRHCAFTFSGTPNYQMQLFIDGSSEPPVAGNSGVPVTSQSVRFGNRAVGPTLEYDGLQDELWILSAALTADDIATIYNAQNDPGLFSTNNGVAPIPSDAAQPFPLYYWYQ